MESKSIELVVRNITDSEIKELEEIHQFFKKSIRCGNRGLDEDIFFHLTLARFSHNIVLESTLAQLYSETYIQTMSVADAPAERLEASIQEHDKLLFKDGKYRYSNESCRLEWRIKAGVPNRAHS